MVPIKSITREDALLWLNDRIGKSVKVVLTVDTGGWNTQPMRLHEDSLKHDDELAGTYTVGDVRLDLSELPEDAFFLWQPVQGEREELRVSVGAHAGIGITGKRKGA